MTDQGPANTPPIQALDDWYLAQAGKFLMDLGLPKLKTIAGDRRMLGPKSPGRADLKLVENPK